MPFIPLKTHTGQDYYAHKTKTLTLKNGQIARVVEMAVDYNLLYGSETLLTNALAMPSKEDDACELFSHSLVACDDKLYIVGTLIAPGLPCPKMEKK